MPFHLRALHQESFRPEILDAISGKRQGTRARQGTRPIPYALPPQEAGLGTGQAPYMPVTPLAPLSPCRLALHVPPTVLRTPRSSFLLGG